MNEELLKQIREAFDGDDIPAKNRMLRKAHDLVKALTVDGPQTFALLAFFTSFYRNTNQVGFKGFWNFDTDENYQSAMAIIDKILKGSTVE